MMKLKPNRFDLCRLRHRCRRRRQKANTDSLLIRNKFDSTIFSHVTFKIVLPTTSKSTHLYICSFEKWNGINQPYDDLSYRHLASQYLLLIIESGGLFLEFLSISNTLSVCVCVSIFLLTLFAIYT